MSQKNGELGDAEAEIWCGPRTESGGTKVAPFPVRCHRRRSKLLLLAFVLSDIVLLSQWKRSILDMV